MPTIAELFVNLGVKGADTSKKALTGVKEGMKDVADESLAAKAAILGVVYGLEQMMKQSVERGTGLVQFAAATGLSIEKLGTLENVFRQFGVSSQEVEGTLKNVQSRMSDISAGKGVSGEFMMFAQKMKVDFTKLNDIPYMLQKFQSYAPQVKPEYLRMLMGSLGFSDNMIQSMIRNAKSKHPVNLETVTGGNRYTTGQAQSLDKANIAWDNMHDKVNKAFGAFFAGHGQKIVKDISNIADQVIRLVTAFTRLSDKLALFERFGDIFKGWGMIFDGITDAVEQVTSDKPGGGIGGFVKDKFNGFQEFAQGVREYEKEAVVAGGKSVYKYLSTPHGKTTTSQDVVDNAIASYRNRDKQQVNQSTNTAHVTVHAITDKPIEIADHVSKAVEKAHKNRTSNTRAN